MALKELFYNFVAFSWIVVGGPAADKSEVGWRSCEGLDFLCGS